MRNLLRRQGATQPRKPLRERIEETKARFAETGKRAGQALVVAKAVMRPDPKPEPAVDRVALVNYATFLAFERDHVCRELYPHLGRRCASFLLTLNAAERFFFPDGYGNARKSVSPPPASSRAVAVLDMAGIDWRADRTEGTRARFDDGGRADTGERPAVPHGWPRADAALLEALDDLVRLDAAQDAMNATGAHDARDGDTVPGYRGLEDARVTALARLAEERAVSLTGLQAKARALCTPSVKADAHPSEDIAASLTRDLLGMKPTALEPRPDPILALIDEARRLLRENERLHDACAHLPESDPAWKPTNVAHAALWAHVRGALIDTVPTTAEGCRALARFAVEFQATDGAPVGRNGEDAVLGLIARSPLL